MKTSELTGAALDWAVAVCEGLMAANTNNVFDFKDFFFSPSTNWEQGGPIIERDWIELLHDGNTWQAIGRGFGEDAPEGFGLTPLVAAMRCYVASKLGDEVEIPEEILA